MAFLISTQVNGSPRLRLLLALFALSVGSTIRLLSSRWLALWKARRPSQLMKQVIIESLLHVFSVCLFLASHVSIQPFLGMSRSTHFFIVLIFALFCMIFFSGVYNLQPDYDKIDGKAHYIKMTSTQRRHLFFDASRK